MEALKVISISIVIGELFAVNNNQSWVAKYVHIHR